MGSNQKPEHRNQIEKTMDGCSATKYFNFDSLTLDCGKELALGTLAYEAYGTLNSAKSNAILVLHAFTGDAHAAGFHAGEQKPGWWDGLIGPGRALDTEKYFVICSNVIGGCRGSTGPGSMNPLTNKPYGLEFPFITIADMVRAQKKLIEFFGIKKLLSVIGGSMGGMQALQWVADYPGAVASCVALATALKHSPQQIAFDEVGRQAVMADPDWQCGNYYPHNGPVKGLAVARMLGHITYMSDMSMEDKFSRKLKDEGYQFNFTAPDFEVEGYLRHRGDSFVKRFDANSYLYITKAMDYFDLSGDAFIKPGTKPNICFLVVAFKSDWLYPAYQSQEIVRRLKIRGMDATYCEINSTYGHDAFLVEIEEETRLIKHFLEKTYAKISF